MDAALEAELKNLEANPKSQVKKKPVQDPWKLNPPKNRGDLTKEEPAIIENEIHNIEKMTSVTVMEEEIRLMNELAGSSKEFADVYSNKRELLEFKKGITEENIQNELITIEKYTSDMKKELAYEKNLLESLSMSKCNKEDIRRVKKRVELLTKEIADCEDVANSEPQPTEEEHKSEEKKEEKKEENNMRVKEEGHEKEKSIVTEKEEVKVNKEPIEHANRILTKQSTIDPNFYLENKIDEKTIDFKKVDKGQYDTVVERENEYRDAASYLMQNGLIEKAQALLKKVDKLDKCLKLIIEGKKIDLLKIEPPITPEIMFNCSKENRDATFNDIIRQLQKQAAPLQHKLEAFKKLSKKDKDQISKQMLPIAKKLKQEESVINTLKTFAKNPWTPVPAYIIEPVFRDVDITNKNIKNNILSVDYEPDAKMAKKYYYELFYELKNDKNDVTGKIEGHRSQKIDIQFPKGTKDISGCMLTLKLRGRRWFFFKSYRAELQLRLNELEHENEIKHQVPEFRNKYVIKVTIRVRLPADGRSIKTIEGKELIVNRIYKPFRGYSEPDIAQVPVKKAAPVPKKRVSEPITKALIGSSSNKLSRKSEGVVTSKAAVVSEADPPLPNKLELPPGVEARDVVDPDNIANLVCVSYLDKRISYYNNIIKQMSDKGNKVPDAMAKIVNQMSRNKGAIEGQIERGVLTPDKYKEFLQMQLEKDKKLLECLEKYKQKKKVAIVKERIECLQNEINSF